MLITWSSAAIIVFSELAVELLGIENDISSRVVFLIKDVSSYPLLFIDGLFSSTIFSSITGSILGIFFKTYLFFLNFPPNFGLCDMFKLKPLSSEGSY